MRSSPFRSLVMVGAFPPPIHGMALVNAEVLAQFKKAGVEPVVLNISAADLDRKLGARLSRGPRVLRRLVQFAATQGVSSGTLYMSVSGGLGQLYEILFLAIARLRRMRCYLHHHSFAYLDKPRWMTRVLIAFAGKSGVHIVLSNDMGRRLRTYYPAVGRIIPISNAGLLHGNGKEKHKPRTKVNAVGFFSNISAEKGIWEFLDLVGACQRERLPLNWRVAGPFQDTETKKDFERETQNIDRFDYLGPCYGEDKESFLSSIDVLVFPSRYAHEAEPLVIHEALMRGIPVIAYGLGAIPEVLESDVGLVVDPGGSLSDEALRQIRVWLSSKVLYEKASGRAIERFDQGCAEGALIWQAVRKEILRGVT